MMTSYSGLKLKARAQYDRALVYIGPYALRARRTAVTQFNKQPQIATAVVLTVVGMLAILTGLPTKQGSTPFAGALFGAGAVLLGGWVTERNRTAADKAAEARRQEAARAYFTPELARIIHQQVWVLGRLVPNFVMASVEKPMPQIEPWGNFRPRRPVLYPGAVQFKDLSETDATALINFYDSVHGIGETIEAWIEAKTPQGVNEWNVLMQQVRDSLGLGAIAVRQFCSDRQLSPLLPASGTLLENIERSNTAVQQALDAHLARWQAKTTQPVPMRRVR